MHILCCCCCHHCKLSVFTSYKHRINFLLLVAKMLVIRRIRFVLACLQAVTGDFIAENPFRFGRHLGFFGRALPGTSGRPQKRREGVGGEKGKPSLSLPPPFPRVAFLSTTARPAPPRRVLSKMAATKRTPGFLVEEKLQRLQVG